MNERSIRRFLIELGVDPNDLTSERGWVNSPCPMAPYVHASGQDSRPSFGVAINEEGPSAYYCFGCTPEGRGLHWLLHNFFLMDRKYPHDAAEIYLHEEIHPEEEDLDMDIVAFRDVFEDKAEPREIYQIPYEVLNNYPLLQYAKGYEARRCREYLEKDRRIPVWAAHMLKVRIDPDNSTLVFPLTDREGGIFTLRARSRKSKRMWTISAVRAGVPDLKFSDIKDTGAMFGLWNIDMRKPVMLVEGELDAIRVASYGFYNVAAASTSSISNKQIDAIDSRTIYLGFDADSAGEFAARRVKDRKGDTAHIYELDWSIAIKEDGDPCKDACDLTSVKDFEMVLSQA